jgi:Xaa-Pro aminopeptidase
MGMAREFALKQARVAEWLGAHAADAMLLQAGPNVAWLASGGDLQRRHGPAPALAVGAERTFLLCASDDADRLRQEEVRGLAIDIVPMLAMTADAVCERARTLLPEAKAWRTDVVHNAFAFDAEIDTLRRSLLPEEVERLVRLARDAAAALEEVAAECYRGIIERDAAARLTAECVRRQIEPREILTGADERLETYVRPLPKNATAERALLLGLVGTRHGLHVALSRTLCLTRPASAFVERFTSHLEIVARLRHETRAGETLGSAVQRALPHPPLHLGALGGTTGYAYPDFEARASCTLRIAAPQPLVWSVASAGARVEDTYLYGASGLDAISSTEGWPRRTVHVNGASYELPDLLLL